MVTETEINRRNFNRAYRAIRRGDDITARQVAKAAIPIEDREAVLVENENKRLFANALAALHHPPRKVAKVAQVDHSTPRSRRYEAAARRQA